MRGGWEGIKRTKLLPLLSLPILFVLIFQFCLKEIIDKAHVWEKRLLSLVLMNQMGLDGFNTWYLYTFQP